MCSAEAFMAPSQAVGQYEQGKMNESYYNYMGDQALMQEKEAAKATEENLSLINQDTARKTAAVIEDSNQIIASQKAAMAANGVYSDSGTFSDIIGDTVDKQALDEAAIKFNADQEVWQTKRQAINQRLQIQTQETNFRIQGVNERNAGRIKATNTLVGGAASGGYAAAKMIAGGAGGAGGAGAGMGAGRGLKSSEVA